MSAPAQALALALTDATAAIDTIHARGLAIPQPVTDAMQVLAAFGMALAANAQGRPAPAEARELLGLAPSPTCGDCGGFGKHAPWCPE